MNEDTLTVLGFPYVPCVPIWGFIGYPASLVYFDAVTGECYPP